jgi:AraC family transcriptional regulator
MEPKMVKKESVKLAGFALKTTTKDGENYREIPKFWQEYLADGRCEKLHGESFLENHAEYGACFPINMETGEIVYVIGVEVKEDRDVPDGYHACTIPEALYAVFTTPSADESNFASSIQGTWNNIYSEWFPNSGYEFDSNGVDFELYDERCMAKTGKVIDIYIPVVKK